MYFKIKVGYNREGLAKFVYELDRKDAWNSYMPDRWNHKKYDKNSFTAMSFRYYPIIDKIKDVRDIRDRFNFSYLNCKYTQFVKFPPYHGPVVHRDTERRTAVLVPIYTFEEYVPIEFYTEDDKSLMKKVHYSNEIMIFDATKLHAIRNGKNNRYSLQFDIQEDFEEVLEMYCAGRLLK